MNIDFREMLPDEANKVHKIGRISFGGIDALFMPKPKSAILALENGEIVGGLAYKIFSGKKDKQIGYAETGFVAKTHVGKGIGNKLYNKTTNFLKDYGCETIIAMVRDDNVASWKALENSNFNRITFSQMLRELGLFRSIWFWLSSLKCIAAGHEIWATIPQQGNSTFLSQIALYFMLAVITLLPALRFGTTFNEFGASVIGILALLLAAVLGGTLFTKLIKQKWIFRTTLGGLLLSMGIAALGGVYPIVGRYYPETYSRSPEFRRNMGLEALFEWVAVLLLFIFSIFMSNKSIVWEAIQSFGTSILLYHAIPIFPFGSFGGERIWNYNKGLSLVVLLISVILLVLL